jgi:hypothetical protein
MAEREPVPPVKPPGRVRFREMRVRWLPLVLVVLNGAILCITALVALVVLPFVLALLLLVALIRLLLNAISGGRWFARQEPGQVAEEPANPTTLPEELRHDLAWRFQPCLMLFPESAEFGPPYRTGAGANLIGADYHPRGVEIFLDHARLRLGRTQWLPDMPETTEPAAIRASLGQPGEVDGSLETPWLHGGNPIKIVRHLFPFARQFRAHWAIPVPKADCGCSVAVWERYLQIVAADGGRPTAARRYQHTLYARVLEGRELPEIGADHPLADAVALQYWWFLFYNDAWNRHQGDWEGITLFLRPGPDGYTPLGAAYASHDLGRWRRWRDVGKVDDECVEDDAGTHPVVYVGRGSHASYFDYNEHGYHPSMSRSLRVPFLGDYKIPSQFILETRNATDWVADAQSSLAAGVAVLAERVPVMPSEATLRDLAALRADDCWWWLAYRGLWGAPEFLPFFGGSGPRGPKWQGVKWSNPFRWVMRDCIADDLPYWLEMFASWADDEVESRE